MHSYTIDNFIDSFFDYSSIYHDTERVVETEDTVVVSIDLPGVKKEDVDVDVDNGYLTISSTRKLPSDEGVKVISAGDFKKKYNKSYKLGTALNTDSIEAELTDGVLSITIPKKEDSKKKSVKIS